MQLGILRLFLAFGCSSLLAMEKAEPLKKEIASQKIITEKGKLHELIVEVAHGELNQVQRARNQLSLFLITLNETNPLHKELLALKERLLQPELLIRSDTALRDNLLFAQTLSKDHAALGPLVRLIADLDSIMERKPQLMSVFMPVRSHYDTYLARFFKEGLDRPEHVHTKALMTIEGVSAQSGQVDAPQMDSYRISQDIAYSLLSKDIYGFLRKKNTQGSHAVSFKQASAGGVHFKGNTAVNGLPVGMEAALYWFSNTLFGHGLSASALVILNEVEKKEPAERSLIRAAYNAAIVEKKTADGKIIPGKTADEFFAENPSAEGEFLSGMHQYVMQASDHVGGISLHQFIEEAQAGKRTYTDLNPRSFSEQVIFSLLTNPSDGTPGNFIVKTVRKPFLLVGIDNDMALGPEFMHVPKANKHSLEVKNVMYCLPLMDNPVDQKVSKALQALDPYFVMLQWLDLLRKQENGYKQMLSSLYTRTKKGDLPYLSQESYTQELHLPLMFDEDLISHLIERLISIQQFLQLNAKATHSQLFEHISPSVSQFYKALGERYQNEGILETFKHICNSNFENVYLEKIAPIGTPTLIDQRTGTKSKRTVDELIKAFIKTTDLSIVKQLVPFITLIIENYADLLDPSQLHESWIDTRTMTRLLQERAPYETIKYFETIREFFRLKLPENQNPQNGSSIDKDGCSLLHRAVEYNNSLEVTRLFMELEHIDLPDNQERTPLDIAMKNEFLDGFSLLVNAGAQQCSPTVASAFYKKALSSAKKRHVEAFFKLLKKNTQVAWQISFEEMMPVSTAKSSELQIETCHYQTRTMRSQIKDQIIAAGGFVPYAQHGNHVVAKASLDKPFYHELYFKVYPELPGLEEAVGSFTRRLLGFGAPYTELINLDSTPVLVSQGIQGPTLLDAMKNKLHLLADLDERDLSGLIIVAMLINPEDGKPDNYVIEEHPTNSGKYRLIGVDNDHAFVPAIVKEKPGKGGILRPAQTLVQVKTILYCLDQMKKPIHKDIRDIIVLLDIDQFIEQWLTTCKEIHDSYGKLFTLTQRLDYFKKMDCFIGIPFKEGQIAHLYEKCIQLKDLVSQNATLSHIELLAKLEPRLAKRYKEALAEDSTPLERFKKVDAPFYQPNSQGGHTTVTDSGMILQSMNIPLHETLFEQIQRKAYGPIQALEELARIRVEMQAQTLSNVKAKLITLRADNLLLNSSWSGLLKSLDFSQLTLSEQSALLKIIQKKTLQELSLVNCESLTDDLLKKCKLDHLKSIDLRGCTKITDSAIEYLAKHATELEVLNLANLTNIKEVGSKNKPIKFANLKNLNLAGCSKLKKLFIDAPLLNYLNVTDCPGITQETIEDLLEKNTKFIKLEGQQRTVRKNDDSSSQPTWTESKSGTNTEPRTALFWAITNNKLDVVTQLLKTNAIEKAPSLFDSMDPDKNHSVTRIAWSPNGAALATLNRKNFGAPNSGDKVRMLNLNQQRIITIEHPGEATRTYFSESMVWSHNATRLTIVGANKSIHVWDQEQQKIVTSLKGDSFAWSPDEKKICIDTGRNTVEICDLQNMKVIDSIICADHIQFTWSPDGTKLAIGSDCTVQIWDTQQQIIVATIPHPRPILVLSWSPDSLMLGSTSKYGGVCIWDLASHKIIATIKHKYDARVVAWSHDGTYFATGSEDGSAQIWHRTAGKIIEIINLEGRACFIAWNPNEPVVYIRCYNRTLHIYDTRTAKKVTLEQEEPKDAIDIVGTHIPALSPDGSKIAIAFDDKAVEIWDFNKHKTICVIRHKSFVKTIAWSPDGNFLCTGRHDGSAQIWLFGTPLDWAVAALIKDADLSVLEFLLSLDEYSNLEDKCSPAILKTLHKAAQKIKESDSKRHNLLMSAIKIIAAKPGAPEMIPWKE